MLYYGTSAADSTHGACTTATVCHCLRKPKMLQTKYSKHTVKCSLVRWGVVRWGVARWGVVRWG